MRTLHPCLAHRSYRAIQLPSFSGLRSAHVMPRLDRLFQLLFIAIPSLTTTCFYANLGAIIARCV